MTLNQSIEEARLLKDYLTKVHYDIYHMPDFKESEIQLRAKTLKGFIAILQNDLYGVITEWNDELNKKDTPPKDLTRRSEDETIPSGEDA